MKLFINILLILSFTSLCAQKKATKDSVRTRSYLPTGVRISADVLPPVLSRINDDFSGYEFNADIDFYRYYLTVDYGSWSKQDRSEVVAYRNDGQYYRIGVDVNFLVKQAEKNNFFLGFRRGYSTFSEYMTINQQDSIWGPIAEDLSHENVNASWWELTSGIRMRIWKIFWLGYTARFKFALKAPMENELVPYDVPGYGLTYKETTWGFNYQIMARIPIR